VKLLDGGLGRGVIGEAQARQRADRGSAMAEEGPPRGLVVGIDPHRVSPFPRGSRVVQRWPERYAGRS
jgi:hypothetical protein